MLRENSSSWLFKLGLYRYFRFQSICNALRFLTTLHHVNLLFNLAQNHLKTHSFAINFCDFQVTLKKRTAQLSESSTPQNGAHNPFWNNPSCQLVIISYAGTSVTSAAAGASEYELKAFSRSPFSIAAINLGRCFFGRKPRRKPDNKRSFLQIP